MAEDDYWREEYARNPPADEPDHAARLAAKDAEIERLRRDLDLAAQHAAAADAECERRIAAHQAAEAKVARLNEAGTLTHNEGLRRGIATERERCARIAITTAEGHLLGNDIADAIRAG